MDKIIKGYQYLIFIVMIYMTIDLSSMVFTYKIIEMGPIIGAASSLIFPLTYSIMDIVAEVYGYQIAKKIIWYAVACDFIFGALVLMISHIPSTTQSETMTYIQVLGSLLRAVIAQSIGVLLGALMNIRLISKWKIMTNGRYFWLRSIGSSTIGEAIMLVISVFIALAGVLPVYKLFQLIVDAYLYKIIFAIVAAPFISMIAALLKIKIGDWDSNNIIVPNILDKQGLSPTFQKV